ncbi:MAG: DUF2997 domain-containing protein [Planctomycetaceae bacterium]|nr:DUF2997 domain-containing protein [Planctomycetaceae bacterium]
MTRPQQIQIDVSPTGESQLQTSGFTGITCQEASRFLEQALGQKISETFTSEYFQATTQQQQSQQMKDLS